MAIKKFKKSSVKTDVRYDSMLAGYPGVMPTPTATDGGTGTTASVAFTAVSGATGYTAISNPGSFTGTGTSSPVTVSGLTTGTAYTFQIRSENSEGAGGYSAASNSLTPASPYVYESIQTATIDSAGYASDFTFSSIPQTYKHLQLRIALNNETGVAMQIRFNSDTGSNYSYHFVTGNGSTKSSSGAVNTSAIFLVDYPAPGGTSVGVVDIFDYTNVNKYKTLKTISGRDNNGSGIIGLYGGNWRNTGAINSITVISAATWLNTKVALYGVR